MSTPPRSRKPTKTSQGCATGSNRQPACSKFAKRHHRRTSFPYVRWTWACAITCVGRRERLDSAPVVNVLLVVSHPCSETKISGGAYRDGGHECKLICAGMKSA